MMVWRDVDATACTSGRILDLIDVDMMICTSIAIYQMIK